MSCLINTPRIAVIGAGIAGLSCATELERAGMRVTVFDKSRGMGGRMSTRRGDGWQADHGAQYFTARDPDFISEVERWQRAGVADIWSGHIEVLGKAELHRRDDTLKRYVGTPRMSSPARWLAAELDVLTASRVTGLLQHDHRWYLQLETGALERDKLQAMPFHAVVLAIPAAQAEALLATHSRGLTELCSNCSMKPCWAVIAGFDQPSALPFDAAFVNEGPLRWIARDNSKPGRPEAETWVWHATTDWSRENLDVSPDTVAQALSQAFSALGGTRPQSATAHRWLYAEPPSDGNIQGVQWDAAMRLGLCGDWLHGGRVEGAWLSGYLLARKIVAME